MSLTSKRKPVSKSPPGKARTPALSASLDGLAPLAGSDALRERLRLLSPGCKIVTVSPGDVLIALKELDAYRISGLARPQVVTTNRRGRKLRLEDDHGTETPGECTVRKLMRFRPDVVEKVERFAKSQGGKEAWSFNKTVNEVLASALK